MNEQRLAELESFWTQRLNREHPVVNKACDDIPALLAEIRRLKYENHLLNLSRGAPSPVGRD